MDINRKTAFEVLVDMEKNKSYSNISLNNFILKNNPDDSAFTREIVYGVLKNKIFLDFNLRIFVRKGFNQLKAQDISLLRMGAYQLLFMDSVPEYAAVSETVELAKQYARGRERFINAVLRNLIRDKNKIIYPKKDDNPFRFLSIMYSINEWIVELLVNSYGFNETEMILKSFMETPDLSIRVNLLKTSKKELMDILTNKGFIVWDTELSDRALFVKGQNLLDTDEYKMGYFSVQDVSSIICSDVLSETVNEVEGEIVIDCCSCPGGKTFASIERLPKASFIAMDVYENKLSVMKEEAKRMGYSNLTYIVNDATKSRPELRNKANRVICDVPCSGLGVLRRKPEIKYRDEYDLQALITKQKRILNASSFYLKKGGILVYSTCTINPLENESQVKEFIETHEDFSIEKEIKLMPTMGVDGFYIAKLRKK